MPQPRKPKKHNALDFALAWEDASCADEVAAQFGLTKRTAETKAGEYRRRGIKLKRFPRGSGRPPIQVDSINKALEEHRRNKETSP